MYVWYSLYTFERPQQLQPNLVYILFTIWGKAMGGLDTPGTPKIDGCVKLISNYFHGHPPALCSLKQPTPF